MATLLSDKMKSGAEAVPACYEGGAQQGRRALVEFRPDAHKRVGFPWAQLCHYTLEPNRDGDPSAAERLTLGFSTADVVLVGARLGLLVDLVAAHDLEWVGVVDPRYAGLASKTQPCVVGIVVARLDKSNGAAG